MMISDIKPRLARLAQIEIDSPIPSEAFMAVAEILAYVYQANGKPNPFNVLLDEDGQWKEADNKKKEDE